MRTFAVVNQKGGCGKTTTAINLAGVLASRGKRTLLVDMDPQGHCAAGLAIPEARIDLTVADAMLSDKPLDHKRLLWRVMRNLDLIPSTVRLASLEASRGELAGKSEPERLLGRLLARFHDAYDVCLIDCSPAIGLLAFNAMAACNDVIIPVETGFFSLQGATKQINAIKSLGKRLGVSPQHHLLPTLHDPESALSQDLLDELRRRFGARVLPTVIRFDHALREAASFGQPVIEYAPDSTGAEDYCALADALLDRSDPPATSPVPRPPRTPDPDEFSSQPRITVRTAPNPPNAPNTPDALDILRLDAPPALPLSLQNEHSTTAAAAPPHPHALSRQLDMVMRAQRLHAQPAARDAQPSSPSGPSAPTAEAALQLVGIPARPAGAMTEAKPLPRPPSPSSAHAARPAFGVTPLEDGLLFVQPASIGISVAVAGDFNHWRPERSQFRLNPHTGALEFRLLCPPGMYQYRVVADGQWMPDPFNPHTAANPFGGSNSVAIVPMRSMITTITQPAEL